MGERRVLNVDLADVWATRGRKDYVRTIAWGDEVTVLAETPTHVEIDTVRFKKLGDGSILPEPIVGYIEPSKQSPIKAANLFVSKDRNTVMKVNFIDVQQGDGAVIESPDGKIILVDGGQNQLFARYLAGRFRGTSLANPQAIDCIVVTHGDADHFVGLCEIRDSEEEKTEPKKQLFIKPLRVYHNGIVKRPGKENGKTTPEKDLLGPIVKDGDNFILTDLATNLLTEPTSKMNKHFRRWKKALGEYNTRYPVEFRRLEFGDSSAFSFFNDASRGLKIEVLGPLMYKNNGVEGLEFLGEPPGEPNDGTGPFSGLSADHTINGHSVVFRLQYGGFSYLFTGDLNQQSGLSLAQKHDAGDLSLRADVLKVPHHGSADFSDSFTQAISPIISVVSSGDESSRTEHIHPRASAMAALGRHSRGNDSLVFVTELIAFFNDEGWSRPTGDKAAKERGKFYGFSRTAWGSLKTRTNGKRLVAYTDSGNLEMKEKYAYELNTSGEPVQVPLQCA